MLYDVKLYDLDAITTTIVMRPNPSTTASELIVLYSLEAVVTDIKLRAFGAIESASVYFGILKRYNGASWVKAKLKAYTGSFVAKPTKRYNGAAWVEIDVTGI